MLNASTKLTLPSPLLRALLVAPGLRLSCTSSINRFDDIMHKNRPSPPFMSVFYPNETTVLVTSLARCDAPLSHPGPCFVEVYLWLSSPRKKGKPHLESDPQLAWTRRCVVETRREVGGRRIKVVLMRQW